MLPHKPVVIAKRRRGAPRAAEMQLLAQCVRGDGSVVLEHPKGEERPLVVELAFEMQERGWLHPPGEPEIQHKAPQRSVREVNYQEFDQPEVVKLVPVRVWRFRVTESGRKAYQEEVATYGV